MDERTACAYMKARFEAAGFRIAENHAFDEDGVAFDIDGFDADRRVGYEFISAESADGWDVDADVVATLTARKQKGELFVLVVDEAHAPDEAALRTQVDAFLAELPPAKPAAAAKKPAAKKPAAKKKPTPKKAAKKKRR